jgi:FO synthase
MRSRHARWSGWDRLSGGSRPSQDAAIDLLPRVPLDELIGIAALLATQGHGAVITYSPKVFLPLTRLCRDVCAYCTFAERPKRLVAPYMSVEEVSTLARAGADAGCQEALFTLGDRPEERYAVARAALERLGARSTVDYVRHCAERVLADSGLLPHLNVGVLDEAELACLRPVAASMGLMLESTSDRLCQRGGPHFGSPDKIPARRLSTLSAAGRLGIPFTTGILIGIGETREERIASLMAIRELHDRYGHIHDVIVQNFVPKPGTRMAGMPGASLEEQLWTTAAARLILGPEMSIQAPPNLRAGDLSRLLECGINDWGGVSPVTPDHVNPESPWPSIATLESVTRASGRTLVPRLPLTPRFARRVEQWLVPAMAVHVRRRSDAEGFARDLAWHAGAADALPPSANAWGRKRRPRHPATRAVRALLKRVARGDALDATGIQGLFAARGADLEWVVSTADALRRDTVGDAVGFVHNRNINYTNICTFSCGFCAFSKGRGRGDLRGPAYNLDLEEVVTRALEARAAGATEVCLQGGIHPSFTGHTYLSVVRAIKSAAPDLHVHAFSPLEVQHGARTLGLELSPYLEALRDAGLGSLPGTAAEILDDRVRRVICPDKLTTREWLDVVEAAHRVGLRTTATIMFGHVDEPEHWATHLVAIRDLQHRTRGFTEFVPLPFVHMEAPLWRKGLTRSGPTLREAVLMHAVARLALHGAIEHVQASWAKLGIDGLALCLRAGADDMGGTLINESITRAAGGRFGQCVEPSTFARLAGELQRPLWQRTTLYSRVGTRSSRALEATCQV